jgi:hypothetical protein
MLSRLKMPSVEVLAAYIGLLSLACFFAAVVQWQRDKRILVSNLTDAVVEKTWSEGGRGDGTYAAISFHRVQAGNKIECRVGKVRVGPSSIKLAVGQTIEIAPRNDSCYEPDVIEGRPPWPSELALVLVGTVAGIAAIFLTRAVFRKAVAGQRAD